LQTLCKIYHTEAPTEISKNTSILKIIDHFVAKVFKTRGFTQIVRTAVSILSVID